MSVDIEEAVSLLLLGTTPVAAIVGEKVFPNQLPAVEEMPCVITRRLSGGPFRVSDGKAAVRRAVFQVESWSRVSQQEARDLDRKVQEAEVIGRTIGSWWVQSLFVNSDTDQDNPQIPINADDLGAFCSFCEMSVFYQLA